TAAVQGNLRLDLPNGWKANPETVAFDLKSPNEQMITGFSITPPDAPGDAMLHAVASSGGRDFSYNRETISYPHIGLHVLMPPAEAKLVRADIRKAGKLIGYIPGAGDDVAQCLQQI